MFGTITLNLKKEDLEKLIKTHPEFNSIPGDFESVEFKDGVDKAFDAIEAVVSFKHNPNKVQPAQGPLNNQRAPQPPLNHQPRIDEDAPQIANLDPEMFIMAKMELYDEKYSQQMEPYDFFKEHEVVFNVELNRMGASFNMDKVLPVVAAQQGAQ